MAINLRQCPPLLRVVVDENGGIDALDEPRDEPGPDEKVYVYRRDGETVQCVACDPEEGGFQRFTVVDYVPHIEQPPDHVLRNADAWAEWARMSDRHGSP